MSDPEWYYSVDRAVMGPVTEKQLAQELIADRLPMTALAYAEGVCADWQLITEIECFRGLEPSHIPQPAAVPAQPPPRRSAAPQIKTGTNPKPGAGTTTPKRRRVGAAPITAATYFKPVTNTVRQAPTTKAANPPLANPAASATQFPRPVVRLCARALDTALGTFGVLVLMGILLQITHFNGDMLMYFVLGYLAVIPTLMIACVEGVCLSRAGYTLGKWLFGVVVRDPQGRKPPFAAAFSRSVFVSIVGLGLYFPLIAPITMQIAFSRLGREKKTFWDARQNWHLEYRSAWKGWTLFGLLGAWWLLNLVQRS